MNFSFDIPNHVQTATRVRWPCFPSSPAFSQPVIVTGGDRRGDGTECGGLGPFAAISARCENRCENDSAAGIEW